MPQRSQGTKGGINQGKLKVEGRLQAYREDSEQHELFQNPITSASPTESLRAALSSRSESGRFMKVKQKPWQKNQCQSICDRPPASHLLNSHSHKLLTIGICLFECWMCRCWSNGLEPVRHATPRPSEMGSPAHLRVVALELRRHAHARQAGHARGVEGQGATHV